MQEKKIKFTDVLFVGLAFFASYFGAGNLIFPPMLGLQSGSNWLSGMIGMLASVWACPFWPSSCWVCAALSRKSPTM